MVLLRGHGRGNRLVDAVVLVAPDDQVRLLAEEVVRDVVLLSMRYAAVYKWMLVRSTIVQSRAQGDKANRFWCTRRMLNQSSGSSAGRNILIRLCFIS